jgi:predicted nucleotidyltransferase
MDRAQAKPLGCADIVEANLPAVRELCHRFGVRRLDLFGSAATGRFDPARSDLDFLVEFEELPPGKYSNAYFDLLFALEELFSRSIDLLTERSLVNPYLRRQIESEKCAIFRRDDQ